MRPPTGSRILCLHAPRHPLRLKPAVFDLSSSQVAQFAPKRAFGLQSSVRPEPELRTRRLILRRWRDTDRAPFAALNADPVVMEYFPAPLARAASDDLTDRIVSALEARGWGLWAVEVPHTATFIGFIGLSPATFDAPFTPAVEVGWRLAREHWGHGYATEGARAALAFGFDDLALDEIVSFTSHRNMRSRRVMERLSMLRDPAGDFDHPHIAHGDPLRGQVLYRLDRARWHAKRFDPGPRDPELLIR